MALYNDKKTYDELIAEDAAEELLAEHLKNGNGEKPEVPPEPVVLFLETEDEAELRTIISNLDDTIEIELPVPEWQVVGKDGKTRVVTVLLRSLTSYERGDFLNHMTKVNFDLTKLYPDLVILTARHPKTKNLLFKSADRGMLNKKMGRATERIAMKAADISGLSERALQEIQKN